VIYITETLIQEQASASLISRRNLYLTLLCHAHRWMHYSVWLLCLCYLFISSAWNLSNCIIV